MSIIRSTPNHTPLKYKCPLKTSNQHDIKHYGTFGSPKIAKHVHWPQRVTWEREWERAWELAEEHVRVYGNV
jgi:hypothetical protein